MINMPMQNVLSELFSTWITMHRGIHELLLCDGQGLPIVSKGPVVTANDVPISAAAASLTSVSSNLKTLFGNASVEYVNIKMRGRKVMIFKVPNQDMFLMFFISSPTIEDMRKMTKTVDYIVTTC